MESSIATFLLRWLACELLPTMLIARSFFFCVNHGASHGSCTSTSLLHSYWSMVSGRLREEYSMATTCAQRGARAHATLWILLAHMCSLVFFQLRMQRSHETTSPIGAPSFLTSFSPPSLHTARCPTKKPRLLVTPLLAHTFSAFWL